MDHRRRDQTENPGFAQLGHPDWAAQDWPTALLTPAQMAQADAAAPRHGAPSLVLMENAGRAVARAIRRRFSPTRTLVLCGPGNNGGDGYVAARLLAQQGWPVAIARSAAPRPASPHLGTDAAAMAARWHGPTVPFTAAEAARAGLVIDALFGAGLARPLDEECVTVLRAARRLVAIDMPSGLDGATGHPPGFAPQAELTVTFFRLKPGHLLLPGRALCGELVLADIGLPGAVLDDIAPSAWLNRPGLWTLPTLGAASHKYTRGHVTVLGGADMTGAARLAAAGARHAGAGLVTLAAGAAAPLYRAAAEPGLIVSGAELPALLEDKRRIAWVCGPGLGADAARAALPLLLEAARTTGRHIVVDADALTACAGKPEALRGAAVLTPHAGEFSRLFGPIGDDKLAAVRAAARLVGCVVLLKGADTVVAAPDGRASINASAPPFLATAGSGDVLAGAIGGLLAQGLPPWDAASAGVWLHGQAANLAGPGLLAEDLPPALGRAAAALNASSASRAACANG